MNIRLNQYFEINSKITWLNYLYNIMLLMFYVEMAQFHIVYNYIITILNLVVAIRDPRFSRT